VRATTADLSLHTSAGFPVANELIYEANRALGGCPKVALYLSGFGQSSETHSSPACQGGDDPWPHRQGWSGITNEYQVTGEYARRLQLRKRLPV